MAELAANHGADLSDGFGLLAKPVEIATFQNAVVTLVLALAAPFWLVVPGSAALVSIGAAAVLSTGSLVMLGWAYARAQAQVLLPLAAGCTAALEGPGPGAAGLAPPAAAAACSNSWAS